MKEQQMQSMREERQARSTQGHRKGQAGNNDIATDKKEDRPNLEDL